jgi:chorismate mutase
MKNINILKIRKKLDKIDIKILNTIKQRSLLVDKILKLKKNKNEVIDQKRINFILKRIKRYSLKAKIDPAITTNIWKAMIKSFIKYEYKKFKRKK